MIDINNTIQIQNLFDIRSWKTPNFQLTSENIFFDNLLNMLHNITFKHV